MQREDTPQGAELLTSYPVT